MLSPSGSFGGRLVEEIAFKIRKKYVMPLRTTGGQIPSTRALAAEFEVNLGTVVRAVSYLASQKLVQPVVGSGTYVLPAALRKSRFGICYGEDLFSPHAQERVFSTLLREFRNQVESAKAEFKAYLVSPSASEVILPAALLDDIRIGLLDGLFVAQLLSDDQEAYLALNLPTVGMGHPLSRGGVFLDHRSYSIQAVETLAHRGARRLALVSGHQFQESHFDRYFGDRQGFLDALAEQALPVHSGWVFDSPPFLTDHFEYGRMVFQQLWSAYSDMKPDGIIIGTDVIALGLLRGARDLGVSLPSEAQVVVAENKESIWPELADCTRFQFSMADVAERVVTMLAMGPYALPATFLVPPKLVP